MFLYHHNHHRHRHQHTLFKVVIATQHYITLNIKMQKKNYKMVNNMLIDKIVS